MKRYTELEKKKKNFLEEDKSLLEKNLKFVQNELASELKNFYGGIPPKPEDLAPPRDSKVVMPTPGFCIKSFKVNTNEKYFINVCQTPEIPAPEDITEEQLAEILKSDSPSTFRIPMSISDPRVTKDKSEKPVDVCDIAVNPKFLAKCQKSVLFRDFFLALIAEALSDKYNIQITVDRTIILHNRKFIGQLVSHRVRNNDVKTVLESYQSPSEDDKDHLKKLESLSTGSNRKPLVEEISESEVKAIRENAQKMLSAHIKESEKKEEKSSGEANKENTMPEYQLRAKFKTTDVEEIQAEFFLPKCVSSQDIDLSIGGDRIVLESKKGYMFDKFIETYTLNQDRVNAIFDKTTRMLLVRIPVYPLVS